VVHDRRVGGEVKTLGVSGKLVDGNLVMYDREGETLWLQATGEGIEGSQEGEALTELPEDQWRVVRWKEWRADHPETLVLSCAHCEGRGEATGTIDKLDEPAVGPPAESEPSDEPSSSP